MKIVLESFYDRKTRAFDGRTFGYEFRSHTPIRTLNVPNTVFWLLSKVLLPQRKAFFFPSLIKLNK